MNDNNKDNKKQHAESLSFQDLTAELGDVRIPLEEEAPEAAEAIPEPPDFPGGTMVVDEVVVGSLPEEPPEMRVLTGSSPVPRPMWLEGLASTALAAAFIAPIILRIGLRGFQPWISFTAMFLALGSALWSLLGLKAEKTESGKKMCYVSAGIGLLVAIIAFLVRAPVR